MHPQRASIGGAGDWDPRGVPTFRRGRAAVKRSRASAMVGREVAWGPRSGAHENRQRGLHFLRARASASTNALFLGNLV